MIISGLASIIKYFRTKPEEAEKSQALVKGLVALLAGVFCAFNSGWFIVTFPVITLIYGVVILITGLAKVQWMVDAIRMKKEKWFLSGISALLSIVCGAIIITSPFSSTAVLWMFTGISLLVEAIFDGIVLLFGTRQSNGQAEYESGVNEAVE